MTALTQAEQLIEISKCDDSPAYFINNYVKIYDATLREWIPFTLWPEQSETLDKIHAEQLVIVLKARQLGLTWLALSYALWLMIFRPISEIGIFSRREKEAFYLLGEERMRGMFEYLPDWLQAGYSHAVDSSSVWKLNTGSTTRAFPTSAGDSYTFTYVIVDEADLAPDLEGLFTAVKPTIDGGGKMNLIGRSDKKKPNSYFKRIYKAAKLKKNNWTAIFLPWFVRPDRTDQWYEERKADAIQNDGTLDNLYEQYPATDKQALTAKSLDKRIPPAFLDRCYVELEPMFENPEDSPTIPGLEIYKAPNKKPLDIDSDGYPVYTEYVIGADPAEGNPNSDDSAATVIDALTGEEMAVIVGKIEPTVFASYIDLLGEYYNEAFVMVERNNHGHTVIAWLLDYSDLALLEGHDKAPRGGGRKKYGWLSSSKGKALMYNEVTDAFKDEDTELHSFLTYTQLASIEGATLLAPAGEKDDRADSFALAIVGANRVANAWLLG